MTDKMTATERLRQLLDERGVVYSREGCETFFKNVHIWAINDKKLCISISGLSPEQAVEATLGRGTCRDTGMDRFECSGCGCTLDLEDAASCEPTMWVDGEAAVPRFCPGCGREVEQ